MSERQKENLYQNPVDNDYSIKNKTNNKNNSFSTKAKFEQFDGIMITTQSYDTFNESESLKNKNININLNLNLNENNVPLSPKFIRSKEKSAKEELLTKIDRLTLLFYGLLIFEIISHYVIGRNFQKEKGTLNFGSKKLSIDLYHCFFLLPFVLIFFVATKNINIYTQTVTDLYLCLKISIDIWIARISYTLIIFLVEDFIDYGLILYLITKNNEYNSKYRYI